LPRVLGAGALPKSPALSGRDDERKRRDLPQLPRALAVRDQKLAERGVIAVEERKPRSVMIGVQTAARPSFVKPVLRAKDDARVGAKTLDHGAVEQETAVLGQRVKVHSERLAENGGDARFVASFGVARFAFSATGPSPSDRPLP
jgi:hypothetical protein